MISCPYRNTCFDKKKYQTAVLFLLPTAFYGKDGQITIFIL